VTVGSRRSRPRVPNGTWGASLRLLNLSKNCPFFGGGGGTARCWNVGRFRAGRGRGGAGAWPRPGGRMVAHLRFDSSRLRAELRRFVKGRADGPDNLSPALDRKGNRWNPRRTRGRGPRVVWGDGLLLQTRSRRGGTAHTRRGYPHQNGFLAGPAALGPFRFTCGGARVTPSSGAGPLGLGRGGSWKKLRFC